MPNRARLKLENIKKQACADLMPNIKPHKYLPAETAVNYWYSLAEIQNQFFLAMYNITNNTHHLASSDPRSASAPSSPPHDHRRQFRGTTSLDRQLVDLVATVPAVTAKPRNVINNESLL